MECSHIQLLLCCPEKEISNLFLLFLTYMSINISSNRPASRIESVVYRFMSQMRKMTAHCEITERRRKREYDKVLVVYIVDQNDDDSGWLT